jgi:predicted transport protein
VSEIKLFKLAPSGAAEIKGQSARIERALQTLIEQHCEIFLGVSFVASEYSTGQRHGGRIDTLGLDENHCPVIVEYKRSSQESVVTQGLYYLDWLLTARAEFEKLVAKKLGQQRASQIDWSSPRVLCIAGDFSRYDEHAILQIDRNIDLIRYSYFGKDLLALQLVDRQGASAPSGSANRDAPPRGRTSGDKPFELALAGAEPAVREAFDELNVFVRALGDDVQEKQLKLYRVYRRIKNFTCVVAQRQNLTLYLKVNPDEIELKEGFTRDVRSIGHWGTGDLEVTIRHKDELREAEPLITKSYENS